MQSDAGSVISRSSDIVAEMDRVTVGKPGRVACKGAQFKEKEEGSGEVVACLNGTENVDDTIIIDDSCNRSLGSHSDSISPDHHYTTLPLRSPTFEQVSPKRIGDLKTTPMSHVSSSRLVQ